MGPPALTNSEIVLMKIQEKTIQPHTCYESHKRYNINWNIKSCHSNESFSQTKSVSWFENI